MNRILSVVSVLGLLAVLWLQPAALASVNVAPDTGPALWIPDDIPALPNATVVVPVYFNGNGNPISSLVFSLDFDQTWLSFDPTDSDGDGIPDAVSFSVPATFAVSVAYDPADTDSELDFFVADVFPPLASLPAGITVQITFGTGNPAVATNVFVNFATDPPASFGSTTGQSVPGATDNGSVRVEGCCDFNSDGQITVVDIQMVALCWRQPIGGSCPARYDVNRSGAIDIVDVQRVAAVLTS